MKNVTRWSPDTCGCVIDYETDSERPNSDPAIKEIVKRCPVHSIASDGEHFAVVLDENRRKNRAHHIIIASLAGVTVEELPALLDQKAGEIVQAVAGIDLATARQIPDLTPIVQAAMATAYVKIGGFHYSEYKWAFDADRNLVVAIPERVKAKTAKTRIDVDKQFKGKVKLQ